ncbi:MAG: extracellular solute-binding protein [Chloroflexi bacterium]|nr:extracellular solute-binding protein [Chloroflexota bacterium]
MSITRMPRRSLLRAGLCMIGLAAGSSMLEACGRSARAPEGEKPAASASTPGVAATAAPGAPAAPTAVATSTINPVTLAAPALAKKFGGETVKIATTTEYYAYSMRMFRDQIERDGNVKITIDVVPALDLFTRNMAEYSSQTTSYDVFMFGPYLLADYAPHLEPVKPLIDKVGLDLALDDILPTFKDYYLNWGGTQYAMSFDGDMHMILYNREVFEDTALMKQYKDKTGKELGPPATWDDYVAIAQFFHETPWRKDGQKGFGVSEGYASPHWWWESRFSAYGGMFFDEELKPLINSQNGILATENLVKTAAFTPPGANNWAYQDVENALIKGEAPLSMNWSSAARAAQDPQKSTTAGKIGYAVTPSAPVNGQVWPSRPALCTGQNLGIPKYSKSKEAAAYVLWFLTRPEVHARHCLDTATGIDAYRPSVLKNEQFVKTYGQQYIDVISTTLQTGFPDLQVPGAFEYYTKLRDGLSQAITKVKPVKEALDGVADEWNKVSQRVGVDRQKEAWNKALTAMKTRGLVYRPIG